MQLLEVFKDFKVIIEGASQHGRYRALFEVIPKNNQSPITVEALSKYVERLQQKHPDRNFYLRHTRVGGREFYVITRKCYVTLPDGTRKRVYDRVPIYFDLQNQKIYVPKSYVEKQKKLVNYIIFRTLGGLGVSRVIYLQTIGTR